MKATVFDLQGTIKESLDLPKVFSEQVREDLIKKAFLSTASKNIQPHGTDPYAGKRSSAGYHGYRRHRWTMMGREMARMPRIHGKASPHLMWRARIVPQSKGGREAHPPKVETDWTKGINKKERQKAIRAAIAATADKSFVLKRNHQIEKIKELPIVIEDKIQNITKTKDLQDALMKLGLEAELNRIAIKKIKAGKGKTRGRVYKRKVGPLFVVTEDKGLGRAVRNLGMDICRVNNLSVYYLAPGAVPGRLTIFTKSAIEQLK